MNSDLESRLTELIAEGRSLRDKIAHYDSVHEGPYNVTFGRNDPDNQRSLQMSSLKSDLEGQIGLNSQSWFYSSVNVLSKITAARGFYYEECVKISSGSSNTPQVSHGGIKSMLSLLESVKKESDHGLLGEPEYLFAAESFESFLEHAEQFLDEKKIREASVLASVVLEDAMKKLAKKHSVPEIQGKRLEDLINALTSKGAFKSVKAKQLKVCGAVRNQALHADWEEIKSENVRMLIEETRDLLLNYL